MLILQFCYGIMFVNPQHTVSIKYIVMVITRAFSLEAKLY